MSKAHDSLTQAERVIESSVPPKEQINWRWCNKCGGLFWAGNASAGVCPAGGVHDMQQSGNYSLAMDTPSHPGQHDWRWCNKCSGLFWAGGRESGGSCPVGGAHERGFSSDYALIKDTPGHPGQHDWHWCGKCSGLYFAGGVNSVSVCPSGGTHQQTGHSDYSLIQQQDIGGDLNTIIDQLGRMPAIVTGSTNLAPPTTTTVDANGVAYLITEQRRRIVNDVIEHAFLQDIAAMSVWPGQVIQGKSLLVGDVASIGPFTREPGKIQIVTDLISNTPQPQSANVDNPDAAQVDQARQNIINAVNPTDAPGLLKTSFMQASTLREVGVKAGLVIKGSAFGVDANATLNQTYKGSVVIASIRQVFYSVSFTPQSAGATGLWPTGTVSYQDLERYIGVGNPPLYIDSVQYGRFICVTAQGAFSSAEVTAALKANWEATVSGNANVDVRTKEILENCEVKIYTLGVPGYQNFQDIIDPIAQLQLVYKSGLSFSSQNPGAPISFTCRHIADGTLAHVGLAAEYTQPLSAQGEDVKQQRFELFDGPGGGLVDTRIRVNPGDTVTISAGGQIWSGVFGSGTHGPEGWPGHRANSAAPQPSGTAYCLVIRFGNGEWIEAGRSWEGSPNAGSGGNLQLNINDNNTYNGDSNKRWEVFVDVKRAGAAAAGVYI